VILDYNNGEIKIELELINEIIVEESTKSTSARKIELKLKKKHDNVNWMTLEKGDQSQVVAQSIPVSGPTDIKPLYPTSAKTGVKNWDKIDKDIEKEMANEKPEGEAALNSLFKDIYSRSDEATRRAMIKSYQTSGGTVLSTNWDEVAKKDYEGRDRPDAPDGQKWAKD
jgi:suppressor of G2 allele of SKP1